MKKDKPYVYLAEHEMCGSSIDYHVAVVILGIEFWGEPYSKRRYVESLAKRIAKELNIEYREGE